MLLGRQADQRATRMDYDPGEHCAAEARLLAVSHQRILLSCAVADRARAHPERALVASGTSGPTQGGCRSAPGRSAAPLTENGRFS